MNPSQIPKLLIHRMFPNAKYSMWIDGKLRLQKDPYIIFERYLAHTTSFLVEVALRTCKILY